MLTRGLFRTALAGAALLCLLWAVACSGGEEAPSVTPANQLTQTPVGSSTPALESGTVAPTPAPTPSPTATPTNAQTAKAAAEKLLSDLNGVRCATPPPGAPCNVLSLDEPATDADFDHGLAVFGVTGSQGETLTIVLGRNQTAQWVLYLWGKQFYNALKLPETITICGFGAPTEVHTTASASADVVTKLKDGDTATAEQFVLTQSGAPPDTAPLARQGYGWYHLAEPSGWVYSKYVAEAADCTLHDQLESR
ncbi:MAG: hypothetical protein ABI559_05110 [Chloroflexota bacterium]